MNFINQHIDIELAKDVEQYQQFEVNFIKSNVDAATLLPILKAAYQAQPISDNSKKLLAQFAQQF
jgi:hypothetical protein